MSKSHVENWRGNVRFSPNRIAKPSTLSELCELVKEVRSTGSRIKVWGSGHSWSGLATTDGISLSLSNFGNVLKVDKDNLQVIVEPGITIKSLNRALATHGLALSNLGAVTDQTIAGAVATATHGTGASHRTLASAVSEIEILTADGTSAHFTRGDDEFDGVVVNLGMLGIVTRLTLNCVPEFQLHDQQRPLKRKAILENLAQQLDENEFFQFYDLPHTDWAYAFIFNRVEENASAMGALQNAYVGFQRFLMRTGSGFSARLTSRFPGMSPLVFKLAIHTILRAKYRRDKSFEILPYEDINFTYSELEYALPRERTKEVLSHLHEMIQREKFYVNLPLALRFCGPESAWLSPAYERETTYFSINMTGQNFANIERYHRACENIFTQFGGRPHWGKHFYCDKEYLKSNYPKWHDFCVLREKLDPYRVFANNFADRYFLE